MSKKIILQVTDGSFETGFSGMIQVFQNQNTLLKQYPFKFPPNSHLVDCYNDWREAYYDYGAIRSAGIRNHRIVFDDDPVVYPPPTDYLETQRNLQEAMSQWLKSDQIRDIKEHILYEVGEESASLIIKTDNLDLQRLPWQIWDLFNRCPQLEVSFFHFHLNSI